mmetsp:Transcript_8123/g.19362  ORF Transcript_8123/g.19362 Transcript_8123/m.19362 type:complete len:244 (-) Transcript_8123:137-868(-)
MDVQLAIFIVVVDGNLVGSVAGVISGVVRIGCCELPAVNTSVLVGVELRKLLLSLELQGLRVQLRVEEQVKLIPIERSTPVEIHASELGLDHPHGGGHFRSHLPGPQQRLNLFHGHVAVAVAVPSCHLLLRVLVPLSIPDTHRIVHQLVPVQMPILVQVNLSLRQLLEAGHELGCPRVVGVLGARDVVLVASGCYAVEQLLWLDRRAPREEGGTAPPTLRHSHSHSQYPSANHDHGYTCGLLQ